MNALAFFLCASVASVAFGCAQQPTETPTRVDEPSPKAAAVPTSPAAKQCERDRIQLLLSAPHDPPTRAELAAACDDPVPLLVTLATDTSLRGLVRLRSIEALGRFGGKEAKQTLAERATASTDLASVRRAALTALVPASVDDPDLRDRVGSQALSDADGHVRFAAARLLSGVRTPAVTTALETAREKETESFVRSELDRALAR
jgi:HEAT repeat protein